MIGVGVDGCRFGWIAVINRDGELDYALFESAVELVNAYAHVDRVFVDIPMGLPWRGYPVRECETGARCALQSRRSSVFSVPCRAAVHAQEISEARALNIEELGRSLSAQTWNICAKISEFDVLMSTRNAGPTIREVHPELAFAQLAGGQPMRYSKKTESGLAERLTLLKRYEPAASKLVRRVLREQRRADIAADDIVDALVVCVVSTRPESQLRTFPPKPKRDQHGIPMEIVYARVG